MLERLTDKFNSLVRDLSGKSSITEKNIEDAVEEIKIALLEADVNLRVVRRFVNRTIEEAKGEAVLKSVNPGQQFIKIIHDKIVSFLGDSKQDLELKGPDTLSVVLFLGLQGAGKTTATVKLAKRLKTDKNRKVLIIAGDLVRPAAVEQLKTLAFSVGIDVYSENGSTVKKVVTNGLKFAKKELYNTVIIDTSGRQQIDSSMMRELSEIKKISNPDESLFVADAMTGQSAVEIAKTFNEEIGITGIILSKFDSDARGGAALSLKTITKRPIKFVGTGEKIDDLEPFYPDRIASRILGMGDIVSLVEKAKESATAEEAASLQKKIEKATFTLEDYLDQFKRIKKMGSLKSVMQMLPGMSNVDIEGQIDEKEMKKEEAIILSMTKSERNNHKILGPSRKKRIAKGSGTNVFEVNKLLKKFEKTRNMMKKMAKNKKMQNQMMSQFGGY
ncbi:signal recognition particle protein [Spirochaeta cellobiosiphila]|uniref:signal recognition particle protein n=1 Tax=Spirochaeta cellobiosiphila TaxID=504483 RepID=UPI000406BF3A|nr:signal recognition particle protein [Spirochaeta cellobiosiphila]